MTEPESLELAAQYLALLAVPGVGTFRALNHVSEWGTVARIAAADHPLGAALRQRLSTARSTVMRAVDAGLSVIPLGHHAYPPALEEGEVKGRPLVLFVAGNLPPAFEVEVGAVRSCAIVGTRRASRYSLELASSIAAALVRHEVVVVSGLALGVDGAAHEGALAAARGSARVPPATVAVLGGGHRHLHPAQHHDLARRIVDQGGAVVSEWPPDMQPARHNFLRRNRIIAALSRCVVVIEAGRRSGALNTAAHALEQGRGILAVPGRPNDPRYAGTLDLLYDGAQMVLDESDVLHQFGIVTSRPQAEASRRDRGQHVPWTSPLPSYEVDERAAVIRSVLSQADEVSLDLLAAALAGSGGAAGATDAFPGGGIASLTSLLTIMELEGDIERTDTGRYRLRFARA